MELVSAVDDAAPDPAIQTRWVVFVCAKERFGFPLSEVREIVPPRPFTRLPGAPRAVCGLVGLRGRAVTVIDAGLVLGLDAASESEDHRLLLLEVEGRAVALAVEAVSAIATARVEASRAGPGGRLAAAVLGTGQVEDAAFVALAPAALLGQLLN
jgi:chemotaxis signal transduction protein